MAAPAKDVLITLYAGERDVEWEKDLIAKCDGKLEIRWQHYGTPHEPKNYDAEALHGATMLYTYEPLDDGLMPNLRFVQVSSAGTDLWHNHPKFLNKDVVFCTTSGSNSAQIAEWVIGSWLRFTHSFAQYSEQQKAHIWRPLDIDDVQDSVGARVGILGYGAIGRQVARLCTALGMTILAFTSTPRPTPSSRHHASFNLPALGDADGTLPAAWFHGTGTAAINDFLAQDLDLLVVALPLTPATTKLLGRAQFDILSRGGRTGRGAFVVNIARGAVLDQDALVDALADGRIRGAAVDVTDPEPLPAGHGLWTAKNCFVTPHVAWQSRSQRGRCLGILGDNVQALLKGQPLLNELKR